MAHQGSTNQLDSGPGAEEFEKLKRLVEIQRQIVELARHNRMAQQECQELRRKLAKRLRWQERLFSLFQVKRDSSPNLQRALPGKLYRLRNWLLRRPAPNGSEISLTPPSSESQP